MRSAGCGRTGTLIGLYSIIQGINYQLENRGKWDFDFTSQHPDAFYLDQDRKHNERVSIFSAVRRIREQRWNLVKNIE